MSICDMQLYACARKRLGVDRRFCQTISQRRRDFYFYFPASAVLRTAQVTTSGDMPMQLGCVCNWDAYAIGMRMQ